MYSSEIEGLLTKKGIKVGDQIKIKSKKGIFEGVLMPRPETGDSSIIIIKRADGYNIGLKFGARDELEKLNARKESFVFPKMNAVKNRSLPKVSLIYTGGTIGSKIDYVTGGVHMLTQAGELLYEVPELEKIADLDVNDLMHEASEDLSFIEWQAIAHSTFEAFKKGARGVVVTMGTDTMHYASAALSFMLHGLNGPVVITGAQRSSDRGSSDAFMDLICSTHLAAKGDVAEVGICMHATSSDDRCHFIRGTKVRKMHTSRRDAFRPINNRPIANVSNAGEISYLSKYEKTGKTRKLELLDRYDPNVALVKACPNSDPDVLNYYIGKGCKGIIIEGTGLGHLPTSTRHEEYRWLENVKKAVESGVIIGITSQCLYGRVNENVYTNLRLVRNAGAIYCEDMLPEVAYVKLGFLLGNYSSDKAKGMLNKNIAGEITERTEFDEFIE